MFMKRVDNISKLLSGKRVLLGGMAVLLLGAVVYKLASADFVLGRLLDDDDVD